MSFWVQHGYGKGDKITGLIAADLVTGGVILSPADEDANALATTAASIAPVRRLLDPQYYVHAIQDGTARNHGSHGLDFGQLSWFLSPRDVEDHVAAVVAANHALGLAEYIAPAPYLPTFNDVWTPIGLQCARAFLSAADGPTFLSVVAEDVAFADWDATANWLDAVTTLDAHGVYLIVGTSGRTYPFAWEVDRLTNVLRVIYALSELNDYEVIWGYSDIPGLAGLAAGAEGVATGWYNSLRMWTPQKWVPQTGGRQATPRIMSRGLLSPIEGAGEAVSVARSTRGSDLFDGDAMLRRFSGGDPAWGAADAWLQHLAALALLANDLSQADGPAARCTQLLASVESALSTLRDLNDEGVALAPGHTTRLEAIRQSVALFAEAEQI